jgi:hypothetical protein
MVDGRRVATAALLLLPAGLMAYFAFSSGGFYPAPPAYIAVILCLLLLIRVLAGSPFEGASWPFAATTVLFGLYVLLTLVSQAWSHAPGRAIVEFNRALVYLLALVLCGSVGRSCLRLAWTLRALAVGIFVVSTSGLVTRLLPHLWPTSPGIANNRLSFPVTYWNVLGLLTVFGLLLCLHFSSDRAEHPVTRALAAAATPILATTLYFTFSRGAIGIAIIAAVVYTIVGRPRLWWTAVVAIGPASAAALSFAYGANLLASQNPSSAGAVLQGHRVAIAVAVCSLAAGAVRGVLTVTADPAVERFRLPDRSRRRVLRAAWGLLGLAAVIALIALSGTLVHEYHGFTSPARPGNASDLRSRLLDPGNDGRIPLWRVAWHRFEAAPVLGQGAGTFQNSWAQYQSAGVGSVVNAHSLYFETLDELGIVGLVLLVSVILMILVATAMHARGPSRPLYAVVVAVLLAWAVHAGVDWDWQMPVVTVVFFSLGGFMLARPVQAQTAEERGAQLSGVQAPSAFLRGMLGVGCLLLAVAPAYVWLSQRSLNAATSAFDNGDCRTATTAALASIDVIGSRPEPYEVLSYCDVDADKPQLAIATMRKAVSLDPDNWNYRYGLAIMQASAGVDPVGAARKALSLNPRDPLVQAEWKMLSRARPPQWSNDGNKLAQAVTTL